MDDRKQMGLGVWRLGQKGTGGNAESAEKKGSNNLEIRKIGTETWMKDEKDLWTLWNGLDTVDELTTKV